jgi:hypothetical protein
MQNNPLTEKTIIRPEKNYPMEQNWTTVTLFFNPRGSPTSAADLST